MTSPSEPRSLGVGARIFGTPLHDQFSLVIGGTNVGDDGKARNVVDFGNPGEGRHHIQVNGKSAETVERLDLI